MPDTFLTPAPDAINCPSCMAHIFQSEPACQNCNYPLQGTPDEQQQFLNEREISQIDFDTHEKQISQAGKTLYWIAGLMFLGDLLMLGVSRHYDKVSLTLGFSAIVSGIFVGLGYWSRTKPTAALITGLCIFILIQLLAAIGDPVSIVKGIFLKIIIIGYLIKGIKSSVEADKMIKEHNFTSYR
ncbi:hypothetical protein ACFQ3S_13340 [Mucilaginibacter terrae]|uniref:hypothetical protein n=1 Tax=Mucilaginibacter terrae TaxID=1955052 RepID=UPI003637BC19